tara:strand:+ start:680 stop:1189 length:510 start_codon:yes stop_codon:yes gene_type:complete
MQTDTPLYSEKQRFRHWWIWVLALAAPAWLLAIIFQQILLNSPSSSVVITNLTLLLGLVLSSAIPIFLYFTGLDTEVRSEGIYIRFRPFHRAWIVLDFKNIQQIESVTYSPLKEYGGWGIRYGKKGKAYNVSGNRGVYLTLREGTNILIGSQNSDALCSVITEHHSKEK